MRRTSRHTKVPKRLDVELLNAKLLDAIRSEDHHTAHALLDEGADVDTCNEEIGWYLHHKAFQTDSSSPNDCTYPGPNSKDDLGDDPFCPQFGIGITPLQIAILLGNQTLVNLLLENKANVHPAHEYSPLVTASWLGFGGIVTLLLRKGADINVGDDNVGMPLQAAAAKGHIEIVNLLLENGADIDETSDPYGTALTAASWHNHIDIVKLLLANLASVNSLYGVSDDFRSPLAAAAERGNLQVVELLLAKDASDYVEENTHDSAIWLACMSRTNLREPILHLLFERVINTNVDWSELYEAITVAAKLGKGYRSYLERLLDSQPLLDAIFADEGPEWATEAIFREVKRGYRRGRLCVSLSCRSCDRGNRSSRLRCKCQLS